MNIYVSFHDETNITIFDLEISQEEDFFARAKLVVEAGRPLPPVGTEGVIRGDQVLFKGTLLGVPLKMKGYFAEIELIAQPPDLSEKMARLQKEARVPPYWDALWVKDPEKWDECQEAYTGSLYCDRCTGELKRSDWFEGRELLTIRTHFFQESLEMRLVKCPLKACTINVHAHWVQQEEGSKNLSNAIRRAFPCSRVNTYTREALLKKWPESGQRIGRSGIWVIKSDLKEIHPLISLYPQYSPALTFLKEGGSSKAYRLKRYWFKPTLWIGWQYFQKRKETLSITLYHAFQPVYPGEGDHKVINFTLQNINPDPKVYPWRAGCFYKESTKVFYKNAIYQCKAPHRSDLSFEGESNLWAFRKVFHTPLGNPARSSFFLTDGGYLAAEHAMERAKVELAKSSRAIEISFEAPWETVANVTTDTSVILNDPRLPGGEIRGKVVRYALMARGDTGEQWGNVTLLCSVGLSQRDLISPLAEAEVAARNPCEMAFLGDYCQDGSEAQEGAIQESPSGLRYYRYDDQLPPHKNPGPLLKNIEVINSPDEQEAMLQGASSSISEIKKILTQNSTCLRLSFKDLRTKDKLEHLLTVAMAEPWSAPRQCSLNSDRKIPE